MNKLTWKKLNYTASHILVLNLVLLNSKTSSLTYMCSRGTAREESMVMMKLVVYLSFFSEKNCQLTELTSSYDARRYKRGPIIALTIGIAWKIQNNL